MVVCFGLSKGNLRLQLRPEQILVAVADTQSDIDSLNTICIRLRTGVEKVSPCHVSRKGVSHP